VTIELARRLLHGGAALASIEAALSAHVTRGTPFVCALLDRSPELSGLVERELARVPEGTPELHLVRPSPALTQRLPRGLCERLLAVPVRRDGDGAVDVAAADVLDRHVVEELSFHLGAPIRLWRAELGALRAALSRLESEVFDSDRDSEAPPAHASAESRLPSRVPTLRPQRSLSSNPPIPLTRRPAPHQVFSLTRARVQPSEAGFRFSCPVDDALLAFAHAESADAVVDALVSGLSPADVLVLAVHRDMFESRAAGGSVAPEQAALGIPSGRGSLLDQALKAGFYLGPVTPTAVHAELRERLGETVGEVYARPIRVASRPVLVFVSGRYGPSLEARRRAEKLGEAAEQALERIVRLKRRKSEQP
jgi:hypothetical protein